MGLRKPAIKSTPCLWPENVTFSLICGSRSCTYASIGGEWQGSEKAPPGGRAPCPQSHESGRGTVCPAESDAGPDWLQTRRAARQPWHSSRLSSATWLVFGEFTDSKSRPPPRLSVSSWGCLKPREKGSQTASQNTASPSSESVHSRPVQGQLSRVQTGEPLLCRLVTGQASQQGSLPACEVGVTPFLNLFFASLGHRVPKAAVLNDGRNGSDEPGFPDPETEAPPAPREPNQEVLASPRSTWAPPVLQPVPHELERGP